MNQPPKARIRQSFERAAATYDSAADIQRSICHDLLVQLPETACPRRLLDAGCGTGFARQLLNARFPAAELIGVDFSPAMLRLLPSGTTRIAGDIEHLPLANHSVDFFWSSLSVQWCDLQQVLAEARRVLHADSQLAIATLGPDTFRELRLAFSGVDRHQHTLRFLDIASVRRLADAAGLRSVDVQRDVKIAYYPNFTKLLKAVKAIGANQLGDGRRAGLMSRRSFAHAEANYEKLRSSEGLPLSYDVIYLYART